MQVGHLRQGEWHLPRVAQGALAEAPLSSGAGLMGRRGASVLQSGERRAHVLGLLLLWVALDVRPGLRQSGDGVQGKAGWAVVGGRVGHLRVAAASLEAGPQVLAGRPAGVRGGSVVDIQQGRAAVHVGGEALQHRGASLLDRGVVGRRRGRRVALWDGRVALRYRRVALVVDGRVELGCGCTKGKPACERTVFKFLNPPSSDPVPDRSSIPLLSPCPTHPLIPSFPSFIPFLSGAVGPPPFSTVPYPDSHPIHDTFCSHPIQFSNH